MRREQIAEAALAIIVEGGLGALTARRVARHVGLSATALYRHFKNKRDILSAVLDLVETEKAAIFRKAEEESGSPLQTLECLFWGNICLFQRYRALPVLFLSDILWHEEPELGERLRGDIQRKREAVTAIIRQGQEAGQIRDDLDPGELYNVFLGTYVLPGLILSRPVGEFDMVRQARINWTLFEEAIRSRAS